MSTITAPLLLPSLSQRSGSEGLVRVRCSGCAKEFRFAKVVADVSCVSQPRAGNTSAHPALPPTELSHHPVMPTACWSLCVGMLSLAGPQLSQHHQSHCQQAARLLEVSCRSLGEGQTLNLFVLWGFPAGTHRSPLLIQKVGEPLLESVLEVDQANPPKTLSVQSSYNPS